MLEGRRRAGCHLSHPEKEGSHNDSEKLAKVRADLRFGGGKVKTLEIR